jgi:hypothetical protein
MKYVGIAGLGRTEYQKHKLAEAFSASNLNLKSDNKAK